MRVEMRHFANGKIDLFTEYDGRKGKLQILRVKKYHEKNVSRFERKQIY
jgi:hypothetical protein